MTTKLSVTSTVNIVHHTHIHTHSVSERMSKV